MPTATHGFKDIKLQNNYHRELTNLRQVIATENIFIFDIAEYRRSPVGPIKSGGYVHLPNQYLVIRNSSVFCTPGQSNSHTVLLQGTATNALHLLLITRFFALIRELAGCNVLLQVLQITTISTNANPPHSSFAHMFSHLNAQCRHRHQHQHMQMNLSSQLWIILFTLLISTSPESCSGGECANVHCRSLFNSHPLSPPQCQQFHKDTHHSSLLIQPPIPHTCIHTCARSTRLYCSVFAAIQSGAQRRR